MKKRSFSLSGVVILALVASVAVHAAPSVGTPAAKLAAVPVAPAVNAAASTPLVRVLIKAGREAHITSQVNGRITTLPIQLGQSFRKGDLLVGFECSHQQADLAAADAVLNKATKLLESKKSLLALRAAADMDVQLADADVAQARAQRDRARASVADCSVLAPYSGSVVRVIANSAEAVSPGSPLIDIVESGNLHVETLVKSSWLTWLKPGQKFIIVVDELGKEVIATVSAIGARVDPVSQTIPVTGRIIQGAPGLRPGMSGNAKFVRP